MSRNEIFSIKWTNLFSVAYQNISKDPCYWQVNKDIRMQLFTFSKCIQTMNKIGAIIPSLKTKSTPINVVSIQNIVHKNICKNLFSSRIYCIWSNPQTSKSNLTLSLISHLHSVVLGWLSRTWTAYGISQQKSLTFFVFLL